MADVIGTEDSLPLRERKKLATRRALSRAALRLAVEHGLDEVRVDDIAAEAMVSPRTFNNYFSSKHEAILALAMDRARRIGRTLLARPVDEPLWDALRAAVLQHYLEESDEAPTSTWQQGLRRALSAPALQGELLRVNAEMQHSLADAIAERSRTDPDTDLFPLVLASATVAASQVAIQRWLDTDPPVPLGPLLQQALDQIEGISTGRAQARPNH